MTDRQSAQTLDERLIVGSFDREFARLHAGSCQMIELVDQQALYQRIAETAVASVGESILRCAAEIEQTFGGITASLWDDPFEWTLPEHLSTKGKVLDHLNEVETLRQRAFTSFTNDACLSKQIMVPAGDTQPLVELLLATLLRATAHQSHAIIALKILSRIDAQGLLSQSRFNKAGSSE